MFKYLKDQLGLNRKKIVPESPPIQVAEKIEPGYIEFVFLTA